MSTPRWGLFAAIVLLATLALLSLSRASAGVITGEDGGDAGAVADLAGERPTDGSATGPAPPVPAGAALLANVALTHGFLAVTVLAVAWFSRVPASALGLGRVTLQQAAIGVALGVALYLASEVGTVVADRAGIEYDEQLRELLAPDGAAGWALLLLGVLPIIAGAEELLFRAAMIGAVGAGFAVPPWTLVVGSSVLFGLGHSAQRAIGVVVTGALGLVLGAAFVLTGSLAVVVVAHYVVNALEFVVREGLLD